MQRNKVIAMGGGTGTFPVITALKSIGVDISTIISVSDSGGSTGRIRDEFGFQPVGDLRQSLAALADKKEQTWIQKTLLYRFSKGSGLKGHNLGNLILTALQDMTEDTTEALEIAEKMFNLDGKVIPVTNSNVNLQINYEDGSTVIGEHTLDQDAKISKKIKSVSLIPKSNINPIADNAIKNADLVIIGPGDHYASLLSTLVVDGIKKTFKQSKAKIMYISNLMTRKTQTNNMSINDHLLEIENAIGKKVNYILVNDSKIPKNILEIYAAEKEFPVNNDLNKDKRVIKADLLSNKKNIKQKYDTAHRSFLRHDAEKLELILRKVLKQL